jgi:signal transduction histidine kinase
VAATTDPHRSGLSVRVRITATVALLALGSLVLVGAVFYTVESRRIDHQVAQQVDQEFAQLSGLADPPQPSADPAAQRFDSVRQLLTVYLSRNVPAEDELLLSWAGGRPVGQSPQWDDISGSQWIRDTVNPLVATNGTTTVDSDYGELQVAVQSVRLDGQTGALVVVTFLDRTRAGLHETMRTYAVVAALALVVVTAAAAWVSGRLLSPLRTLRETADDITETDLSRRLPVTGNDDITALTRTFNGMLDRLEAAFGGQRQFLDDAGHELRTPLTVLRGHLELLDPDRPDDIVETRELLLDEVDRMARLVGDLILLAKSDRPDFLRLRPVDLERLTEDLLAKARALADRTWVLDGTAAVKVVADEQRLTQALLQLADNAVKHTGPGDTVAVGSSHADGAVRLWVRDTGPGVPPADRELVFERFGRSAVPPGDEGFGLGLSIVAAIVHAHGGQVAVEDADPPGARFVITLPAADPADTAPQHQEDPWLGS